MFFDTSINPFANAITAFVDIFPASKRRPDKKKNTHFYYITIDHGVIKKKRKFCAVEVSIEKHLDRKKTDRVVRSIKLTVI